MSVLAPVASYHLPVLTLYNHTACSERRRRRRGVRDVGVMREWVGGWEGRRKGREGPLKK
eukprot:3554922-Rhodomonas_salina.2